MSEVPYRAGSRGPSIHIESGRYLLRSLGSADITPRFMEWMNDRKMLEGLNLPAPDFSLEEWRAFVDGFDQRRRYFIGIFDRAYHLLIGFYLLEVDLFHKVANITTGIGEERYRGKGILWETIDALLDHMHTYRDVDKIVARILARNHSMLFNFKNNPRFVFEAVLRKECLSAEGKRLDILIFASHK